MFSKLQKFSKFFNGNKSCQFYYVEQNCFQLGQSLFQTSKTEHLAFPTRICSKTRTFLKDLSSRIKYLSPCQIWFGEILPNPQPSIVHQFMTYFSQMLWKIPKYQVLKISPISKRLFPNPLPPPHCAPHCPKPSTKVPRESEPSLHLTAADWQTHTQTQRILREPFKNYLADFVPLNGHNPLSRFWKVPYVIL